MTITIQPSTAVALACSERPDLWFSAEHADRALAAHTCLTHCPILDLCRTRTPAAGSVQAGVVYGGNSRPVSHQPKPSDHDCVTCHPDAIVEKRPDDLAALVARIRELADRGLTDSQISIRVSRSKRQVLRLRTAHGITPGVPAYRTRVAA